MIKKLKTIKKWWNKKKGKSITWGDYAKMCKWSFGIVGIFYAIIFGVIIIKNVVYKHRRKTAVKYEEYYKTEQ